MRRRDKKHGMSKVFMLAIALLLFSSTALAIGVAPSKRIFDFKPGETVRYGIDIVNNGQEDLEVLVYVRGEFKENVKISQQMLKMSSDDKSKHIDVEFRMPDRIDVAGPHELEIVAVGSTPAPEGSGSVVKADLAVISKLVVDVPYPDKYAEAKVHILDTEDGRPVAINVPVFNKGKQTIDSLSVEAEVYDSDGEKVDSLKSDSVMLRANDQHKFVLTAAEPYANGEYTVKAVVHYDDKQLELESRFNVGTLSIEVRSLVVNDFTLGGVAKFDILLYNSWSTDLKNVYAEMEITGPDNKVYSEFKTVAVDIAPKQVGALEGYWYTQGVMPGVYTAKITLHYANRMSQKLFELDVYPDRIVAREVGVTGKAISSSEELDLRNNAFLILVIAVMGIVIAVLVYKLRKKGGGGAAVVSGKSGGATSSKGTINKDRPAAGKIRKTPSAQAEGVRTAPAEGAGAAKAGNE